MVKVAHLKRTASTETQQAGTLMLWRGDVFGFGRLAGASSMWRRHSGAGLSAVKKRLGFGAKREGKRAGINLDIIKSDDFIQSDVTLEDGPV